MKIFNPDKELRKIQRGNKNKVLYGIILFLLIISIGSTYALYQVRYSKRIIYTKIAPFSNHDINIMAVYLDNQPAPKFPTKDQNYIYDHIVCDDNAGNHVNAHWDYDRWLLVLETNEKAKCDVYFRTGTDRSGANPPELYQGLIPITFDDDGNVLVADTSKEWYNYYKKEWANAVLVTNDAYQRIVKEDGTYDTSESLLLDDDILQMYVWIPRYKYQLFNVNNGSVSPQMINIEFEDGISSSGTVSCEIDEKGKETCINAINGNWYTHPAFTFGNTDLTGFWIGKFESGGTITNVKILPGLTPLYNQNIFNLFKASRDVEEIYADNFHLDSKEIDTHMMKNMEWGAMAYLTQSKYGRCNDGMCTEVIRNSKEYITGYDDSNNLWNTEKGIRASTTGNIYGIYDVNGGAWEYSMGVMVNVNGELNFNTFGFTSALSERYYDKYEYGTSYIDHQRGHLGDATRETLQTFGNHYGGWYNDLLNLIYQTHSWAGRGGRAGNPSGSGIFASDSLTGEAAEGLTSRFVMTIQDGEE